MTYIVAGIGVCAGSSSNKKRTVRTALLVSIPVAVALLVLLFVAMYLCKNSKCKVETVTCNIMLIVHAIMLIDKSIFPVNKQDMGTKKWKI
jgi:cytochrome bd-type quinol oxidase subunit 2